MEDREIGKGTGGGSAPWAHMRGLGDGRSRPRTCPVSRGEADGLPGRAALCGAKLSAPGPAAGPAAFPLHPRTPSTPPPFVCAAVIIPVMFPLHQEGVEGAEKTTPARET